MRCTALHFKLTFSFLFKSVQANPLIRRMEIRYFPLAEPTFTGLGATSDDFSVVSSGPFHKPQDSPSACLDIRARHRHVSGHIELPRSCQGAHLCGAQLRLILQGRSPSNGWLSSSLLLLRRLLPTQRVGEQPSAGISSPAAPPLASLFMRFIVQAVTNHLTSTSRGASFGSKASLLSQGLMRCADSGKLVCCFSALLMSGEDEACLDIRDRGGSPSSGCGLICNIRCHRPPFLCLWNLQAIAAILQAGSTN